MKQRITLALKGACMGFADAIPGVSGGTMALILGVYERFIAALTVALSPRMLSLLLRPAFWRTLVAALVPGRAPKGDHADDARHLAFLLNILVGILLGLGVGVAILPSLMDNFPQAMRAFFFGLVMASIIVPWARIDRHTALIFVLFAASVAGTFVLMGMTRNIGGFATTTVILRTTDGAALRADRTIPGHELRFAADTGQKKLRREISFSSQKPLVLKAGESQWRIDVTANLSGKDANLAAGALVQVLSSKKKPYTRLSELTVDQPATATGGAEPELWYVFVCGAVAICAMLLPGVSGSFLLLMLGLYGYVLHALRDLAGLHMEPLVPILVFVVGVVAGLTVFSRVLRYALEHWHDPIMAVLAGLMLGSLRSLWPFREGAGHQFHNVLPTGFDATVGLAAATFALGVVIVTILHRVDKRGSASTPSPAK